MVNKTGKQLKQKMHEVGVLQRASLLSKGLRLPNNSTSEENSSSKKGCHVDSHVIFLFVLEVLHRDSLGVVYHSSLTTWAKIINFKGASIMGI
jgi:hypothetical protein